MSEVRLIARAAAREGKAEELKALLAGMVKPTRAEAGCKFYEFFASNEPGVFYFNELWQSREHLKAHEASMHFVEILGKAKDLTDGPMRVDFLTEVK
jgi:quinol monooxygenase YgiN